MKVKLTSFKREVIPDINLRDSETNEIVENANLKKSDQIKAEITYANPEQKFYYLGNSTETKIKKGNKKADSAKTRQDWKIEEAIREHVKHITGCLRDYFRDGNTLWDGPVCTEREDLIVDLFFRICGIRLDSEPDDGPGELTEGESEASE